MRLNRMRLAVSAAALAAITGTVAPAASAATAPGTPPATPATSTTSCVAPNVWLKVWGATGEHCYTGNGAIAVDLPAVREAQVLGLHEACLYTLLRRDACITGPRLVFIIPVITVTEITMLTY